MKPINEAKKKELLDYIMTCVVVDGFPPSISEMCRDVNISSKSLASYYLRLLEKDGKITIKPKTARGIKVIGR